MQEEIKEKSEYCLNCKVKPCQKGCPLGNDIPSFIKAIKEQNVKKAYEVLTQTTVLGAVCGRICPHEKQCQGSCVRGIKGEPVSIGQLEDFVFDEATKQGFAIKKQSTMLKGKKVAVIGSGPAGLTCSAFLARNEAKVTIYEKREKLGGILRYGIPEFRLSKETLDNTIQTILDLEVEVKTNWELGKDGTIQELKEKYDAVFLSFGANVSSKMKIPGEELSGVMGGNELLEQNSHPDYTDKKVAVIGGGNVAMDTARTIKRLGAKEVYVVYRRKEKQMPAEKKEIRDAKEEGIEFLFQNNIIKIVGDQNKKVEKIECVKTELIKKEGETREVPVNIQDSNYFMPMDYVVMAVGSKTNSELLETLGLEMTNYGYLKIDENYQTSDEKIYAGGDLAGGKATVAWAARSGKKAAEAIKENLLKRS